MRKSLKYILLSVALILCVVLGVKGYILQVASGTWAAQASLTQARSGASAVLLQDGRVLVTGGDGVAGTLASAEIIGLDGTASTAASMSTTRSKHVSAVLANGSVLVAGGTTSGGGAINTAEIYDPVSNSWTSVASVMIEARSNATATVLQDGRVLIAGGDRSGVASSTIEIFDPAALTFSFAGALASPRTDHAMALLSDGRVFIAGGSNGSTALNTTDIYDPVAGSVSAGPALSALRMGHSATTMLDGRVLIAGGNNGTTDLASAEIFDPVAGTITAVASSLSTARQGHLAFLLPNNNTVLIAGGTSAGVPLASAEVFTPWLGTFAPTGSLTVARSTSAGSPMKQDGLLVVAGGQDASGVALANTDIYGFATVKTDAADYPPGTTVNITGSGWQPGETVTLTLVESPLIDTHGPFTVVADANGSISDSSFVTDTHDINIRFSLTASGSVSQSQTTFTDSLNVGKITVAGPQSPTPVIAGGSATYPVTVTFSSNGGSCTSTLSASGLPTGASASFSNNPFTSTGTGPDQNSVLTVTTSASTPAGTSTITITANGSGGCGGSASTGTMGSATSPSLVVVGTPTQVRVETAADGSGTVIPAQNVASGSTVTAFAIERDASNNFVANVAATWLLTNVAGGVVAGDLVPSGDTKSATFTGHMVGSANIHVVVSGVTSVDSGTLTVTAAAASKLVFTTQPSGGTGGTAFSTQPIITVQDANGNTVTSSTASIALAIGTNPSGGTLSGTTTVSAVNGVATFSGLSINKVGNGYTLTATSTGLTPGTSSSFNIAVGTAAKLAFTTQPSTTATSGVAFTVQPVVSVQDAGGNTVTASNASIMLAITSGTGTTGAALTCNTNPLAAIAGVATYVGCKIDKAGTGYTLTATSNGLTSAVSTAISVSAGTATQLVFTTQPSSSATGGTAFTQQPVVTVEDGNGNTVTSSTASIALAIGTNPSGGTLSGTTTVSAINGVATFTGLSINKVGNGYTLTAASNGLANATSTAINVTAGAATKLVFSSSPSSSASGVAFGTQPVVTAQDAGGNTATGSSAAITLTITAGTGTTGAALMCTTNPLNAASGIATFAGCKIDKVGTNYTLTASSGNLTTATSGAFNITAGAASKLVFTQQPSTTTSGQAISPAVVVQVQDQAGNLVTTDNSSVAMTISTGGAFSSGSTLSVTASGGVATFSNLVPMTAGTFTLTASDGSLSNATSNTFTVNPGALAKFVFSTISSPQIAGTAFNIVITAEDANNNTVTSYTGTSDKVMLSSNGTILGGSFNSNPFSGGVVGVSVPQSITITNTGNFTITATATGNSGVTGISNSFTVNPGAANKLAFGQQPSNTPAGQAISPAVTVQVQDTFSNLVTTSSALVGLSIATNPSSGTLSGVTSANAVNGVATFSNLSINKGGVGYTLAAASTGLVTATSAAFNVNNPSPTLTAIAPTNGNISQTLDVIFTGTNFITGVSSVNIGGADITVNTTTVNSATQITANVTITSNATVGARNFSVTNSGPGGGTSATQTFTVNNPATTTAVVSSLNQSTFGQSVTFTANVSSVSGAPTGSVTFYDGGTCAVPGTSLSGSTLSVSGQAAFSTSALSAGSHTILACYAPTGVYLASFGSVTQVVSQAQATLAFDNLTFGYDGTSKPVTVTTNPANLTGVTILYNGGASAPINAGTMPVSASLTNANYTATTITGNETIQAAPVVITITDPMPTYDGSPHTATISVVPPAVSVAVTYNGSGTAPTAAGTYAVVVTTMDANYAGLANGTLTIKQAQPTVTWTNPADISFGTALSSVQLNATAAIGATNIPGTFTYTPAAGTVLNAGDGQTLSADFAPTDFTNYAPVLGTHVLINVKAAPLYVVSSDGSRAFGQTNPMFTPTFVGLTDGDMPNTVGSTVTCLSGAGTTSAPGTYAAICSGVTSPNYTVKYIAGTLLVSNPLNAITQITGASPNSETLPIGSSDVLTATGQFANASTRPLSIAGGTSFGKMALYTPVSGAAVAEVGGVLYAIGGVDGNSNTLGTIQAYNPTTDIWTVLPNTVALATPRTNAAVASAAGKIYVIGGKDASNNVLSSIEVLDTTGANPAVSPFSGSLSVARSAAGAAVFNQKLYVIGGSNSASPALSSVDIFDLVTGNPTPGSADAGAILSQASAAVLTQNNISKLYVAGVSGSSVGLVSFDGTNWSSPVNTSLDPAQGVGVTSFGGLLYLVNGATMWSYDGNSFVQKNNLANAHSAAQPVSIGSLIYVASAGSGTANSMLDAFAPDELKWTSAEATKATVDQSGHIAAIAITNPTVNIVATSLTDNSIFANFLLTITKKTQTIQFGALGAKNYGDADFTISATSVDSSSAPTGLLVGFTAGTTDGCTVGGSTLAGGVSSATVHITGAGSCTITAAQPGDDTTWQAATSVPQTFAIAKAALTVTAADATRYYGVNNPTFTGTITGIQNGDNITATYASVATATSPVGTYPIMPTLVDPSSKLGNYNVTSTNGTLTVKAVAVTVTADVQTKVYGDNDPALTYKVTTGALVNGDSFAGALTRDPGTSVGTYAIKQGSLALSTNYNLTYAGAIFTITPRPASVTPAAASKTYGTADPTFTGTLTGFITGDSVTATYTRTAGETVAGSPYAISATLAPATVLGNYNITYNTAAFTINKATASVTPAAASKTYGKSDPIFTGTLAGFIASDGVTATYTRTAGETVAGSPYAISATLAPTTVLGNYNITYNTASFTITPAPLFITASSGTMIYGGPVLPITASYSGFVNGDGSANLSPQPSCGSATTSQSPVGGLYVSSCTGAGDSNYNITYVPGTVTVMPATTTTAVVSSSPNNTSTYMQLVTFTATVVPQYAGTTPTGTVTFYNNGSSIGTGTLSATSCGTAPCADQATLNTSSLPDNAPDNITVVYSGDGNFVTSTSPAIIQTVLPAPNVSLSPMSVSFGNQNVNTTSKPAAVILTNIGDATLNINMSGITISPNTDFAQANNCGASVLPTKSCTISITFSPVDTGIRTAVLQITDNDDDASGAQQTVALTGSGLSTIPGTSLFTDAVFATANGCGSIVMSGGSTVDSFNSSQGYASTNAQSGGNVGTNGNVTLNGSKSAIYGSVAAASASTGNCSKTSITGVTTSGGAQVTGPVTALNGSISYPNPPAPNPAPPTTTQNISGSCGSVAGCSNTGSKAVSLMPGQYGNLTINGGTTAHFSHGTYNINSLTLSGQSILLVDSGPIVINLAGASLSGGNPAMDATGGAIQNPTLTAENLQITYAGSRGLNLSGGAASYATVYAPNALVNMSGGTDFFGSIIASTVTNSGGTAIHYDSSLPAIASGNYIWFDAIANNVGGLPSNGAQVKLYLTNSSISFTANGTAYTVPVPNAVVTFNSASQTMGAKTSYDPVNSRWSTAVAQSGLTGNTFVTGVAFQLPSNFPTGIQNVAWSASYSTDTPGITLQWQWGAAVYSAFSGIYATTSPMNNNVLGVNAEDGTAGSDPAGTPETYKSSVIFGATGGGGTNYTGYLGAAAGIVPTVAPMSVSPSSLSFGTQNQGSTSGPMTVTLTNNDSIAHIIFTIKAAGTNASDFTPTNTCPISPNSLAAGSSCTITVTFSPGDVGTRTAKVAVNDDANNTPQTVYLSGAGQ